ncbi:MAG: hypothetical protein CM15mP21_6770 [Hyphomicrobiales bacterium]|nr:MAG: hypothetical protein CM15mP21_6770 [Hyphomicrobiales bacterium]
MDSLVVAEAYVGKNLVMKRFARVPRGVLRALLNRLASSPLLCAKLRESVMGQKVNPIGMRLGVNRTWESRWYAGKGEYAGLLHEDLKIRDTLMRDLRQAALRV